LVDLKPFTQRDRMEEVGLLSRLGGGERDFGEKGRK